MTIVKGEWELGEPIAYARISAPPLEGSGRPMRFLVDTGSPYTCILPADREEVFGLTDPTGCDQLHLSKQPADKPFYLFAKATAVYYVEDVQIELVHCQLSLPTIVKGIKRLVIPFYDPADEKQIRTLSANVLGRDLLQHVTLKCSEANDLLTFSA